MVERWWDAVEQMAASMPPFARRSYAPQPDLAAWCRRAGAERMILSTRDVADVATERRGCLGLPGSLETVDDPQGLLHVVAEVLGPKGECVAAVTWMAAEQVNTRRSFHPASLIGLMMDRFAVTDIAVGDGVLAVSARTEPDPESRLAAGQRALLSIQPALEAHLDRVTILEARLEASRDAQETLEAAVAESDTAHKAARRERNEARARLREERARREDLEQRLAEVGTKGEQDLRAANRRVAEAQARLASIENSRWWQLRELLLDARRRPLGMVSLPARLWRLRKARL